MGDGIGSLFGGATSALGNLFGMGAQASPLSALTGGFDPTGGLLGGFTGGLANELGFGSPDANALIGAQAAVGGQGPFGDMSQPFPDQTGQQQAPSAGQPVQQAQQLSPDQLNELRGTALLTGPGAFQIGGTTQTAGPTGLYSDPTLSGQINENLRSIGEQQLRSGQGYPIGPVAGQQTQGFGPSIYGGTEFQTPTMTPPNPQAPWAPPPSTPFPDQAPTQPAAPANIQPGDPLQGANVQPPASQPAPSPAPPASAPAAPSTPAATPGTMPSLPPTPTVAHPADVPQPEQQYQQQMRGQVNPQRIIGDILALLRGDPTALQRLAADAQGIQVPGQGQGQQWPTNPNAPWLAQHRPAPPGTNPLNFPWAPGFGPQGGQQTPQDGQAPQTGPDGQPAGPQPIPLAPGRTPYQPLPNAPGGPARPQLIPPYTAPGQGGGTQAGAQPAAPAPIPLDQPSPTGATQLGAPGSQIPVAQVRQAIRSWLDANNGDLGGFFESPAMANFQRHMLGSDEFRPIMDEEQRNWRARNSGGRTGATTGAGGAAGAQSPIFRSIIIPPGTVGAQNPPSGVPLQPNVDRRSFLPEIARDVPSYRPAGSLLEQAAWMVNGEVGFDAPIEQQIAQLETAFNRVGYNIPGASNLAAALRPTTLNGYYPPTTYAPGKRPTPAQLMRFKTQVWDRVVAGSNVSDVGWGPMTGNASNQPGNRLADKQMTRMPGYRMPNGEYYFRERVSPGQRLPTLSVPGEERF